MSSDLLKTTEILGTVTSAGTEYGRRFETPMLGFCRLGVCPNKRRLNYARRCWQHIEKSAPVSASFMRGLARGSRLSLEHITLTTLHEEIYHQPHCTAFAVPNKSPPMVPIVIWLAMLPPLRYSLWPITITDVICTYRYVDYLQADILLQFIVDRLLEFRANSGHVTANIKPHRASDP